MRFSALLCLLMVPVALFALVQFLLSDPLPQLSRLPSSVAAIPIEPGVTRQAFAREGIPIEVFSPADLRGPTPAIVIVHGLNGSKERMHAFANILAKAGYRAVLYDLAGHGASPKAFPDHDPLPPLADELAQVVSFARSLPNVSQVALLGHSLGAGVVVYYAVRHPQVVATIEVSGSDLGDVAPDRPQNLLLLVGSAEIPEVKQAYGDAAQQAGVNREDFTDFLNGRARKAVVIPNADHTTILIDPESLSASTDWLNRSFTGKGALTDPPNRRWAWLGFCLLSCGLMFILFTLSILLSLFSPRPHSSLIVPD